MTESYSEYPYHDDDQGNIPDEGVWPFDIQGAFDDVQLNEYYIGRIEQILRENNIQIQSLIFDDDGTVYGLDQNGNYLCICHIGQLEPPEQPQETELNPDKNYRGDIVWDKPSSNWEIANLKRKFFLGAMSISILAAAFLFFINRDPDNSHYVLTPGAQTPASLPSISIQPFQDEIKIYTESTIGINAEPLLWEGWFIPCGNLESTDPSISKGSKGWSKSDGSVIIGCFSENVNGQIEWSYHRRLFLGYDSNGIGIWSEPEELSVELLDWYLHGQYCLIYSHIKGCQLD